MVNDKVVEFARSQQSLHLYKNIQDAFVEVLNQLSNEQFENIRDNLIIMAFHNGINGQVMHFDARKNKFTVMQLYIPNNMPDDVLRWVVAHELGHVVQGRNWAEKDGISLEDDATAFAARIGYPKTEAISKWLNAENS